MDPLFLPLSFSRYLSAKRTVDDRALNRPVWDALAAQVSGQPIWRVLEIGAGIGTMFQRMVEWGLLTHADYTAIDSQAENITCAADSLPAWAASLGLAMDVLDGCFTLQDSERSLDLRLETVDLYDFLRQSGPDDCWDMVVANAFLDLVDVPATLPQLINLSRPGGLFYLTINFDGLSILEPQIDARLDEKIMALYHQSMDERIISGQRSGDSRTGRHMFRWLREAGLDILSAGSSDWAVYARGDKYTADEAYFLHFILHFIEESLLDHPALAGEPFVEWLAERRAQIARGELVYIAHQMDFLAQRPL